jgi:hypothetical protein
MNESTAPPLTSFLGLRSRICALLLVFGFFSVFGRWFIWVFVLIVAVLVLSQIWREVTPENWERFKQKETKAAKSPFSSSERTVFVSLVSSVGQRSLRRAAESPSRTGGETRARAPKTYLGARDSTISSKRGSPRSGSQNGNSFRLP